jgi:hypothetical protein
MVARNADGRVAAGVLKDLACIGYLASTSAPGGPRFEVPVVHHTQCGTHFPAADEFRRVSLTSSAATRPWPGKPSPNPRIPIGTHWMILARPDRKTRTRD